LVNNQKNMKVIQFTIPVATENSVIIQEEKQPYFYNHLHRHNETQITWIVKGEGTLVIGNFMQIFKAGDIYIIGANQPHVFKNDTNYFEKDSTLEVHAITIFFNQNTGLASVFNLPEMKVIKKFIESTTFGLQASADKTKQIIAYIQTIQKENNGYRVGSFIKLLQFLADLKNWKILTNTSPINSFSDIEGIRMSNIYQFTMENYSENIKLQQVADLAFLTPEAFCRYFKKHTRKTYINFLNEIRINEACKKIFAGDFDSIASVAYDSGFKSAVSFNRVFKKITGKSPLQYRNDFNEKID
jgi:AraC-like DNA-binding protein/mannose-6-phosphate isomerase-like protein (cupin superfamily)